MANNRTKALVLLLLLPFLAASQDHNDNNYSFLVAGHGYGAHAGTNIGLHPLFLEQLPSAITPDVFAIFLTGDLVNQSNKDAWVQVESELKNTGVPSYYCMGNHDSNTAGYNAFNKKHGGTFYTFNHSGDCFIVLNSTITERSISPDQLQFLRTTLQDNDSVKRVFIFFHEVLWNSDIKYKGVMSNSRSRYSQIKGDSNFWTDISPLLSGYNEKEFYFFAGDVGGNTDAIAAFYDVRDNMTLVASGMGEVADENFLKVEVLPDTVKFTFIPLREGIIMGEAPFYNVPENPGSIAGPVLIDEGIIAAEYRVNPVFNATSYSWILPKGVTGESDSSSIVVEFGDGFVADTIAVVAVHDGYGMSQPSKLKVEKQHPNLAQPLKDKLPFDVEFLDSQEGLSMSITGRQDQTIHFSIFDLQGRCLKTGSTFIRWGTTTIRIEELNGRMPLMLMITDGKVKVVRKITGTMPH